MWADTVAWDLSKKTYTTGTNEVTWTSSYAIMHNSGTNATNYLGGDSNNRTSSRFYSGNTLTITPLSGYTISSIVFTATSENYANTLKNSTWTNATAAVSTTIVTVTPTNGANVCSATIGGTCGFTNVTVTYSSSDGRTVVSVNSLTFDPTSIVVGGATAQATAGHNTQACTTATFTYESLDEDKATCTSAGVITAVAKGTARIKATMSIPNDDPNYRVGTATITEEITVSNPSHDAIFMANGVEHHRVSIEEGEAITFPASNPADLGGKKFMGWVAATIDEPTNVAPSFVTSANMSTSDITYYAVYATAKSSTDTKTDEMTLTNTGVSGSSYSSWNNMSLTSDAVYAGNNAGGNDAIQLRSGTSKGSSVHSGIVSTTSGGKVKKITVVWNSNTANDRTLDIYGKNSTYTSVENLYGSSSDQGTKLGSIVKGTSTVLTVTGDYTYVGLRSNDGAMYFDEISIDWETGGTTYSAYCTSITESIPVTAAGWATYCSEYPLDFTDITGLTAYTASVDGVAVKFNKVTGKVPAETGLLISGSTTSVPVAASADPVSNILEGVTENTDKDANTIFVLKNGANGLGFYKNSNAFTVRAHSAYLPAASIPSSGARVFIGFDDETTGINTIENGNVEANDAIIYNLNGQRVVNPTKGLYIVNGKKVMINK